MFWEHDAASTANISAGRQGGGGVQLRDARKKTGSPHLFATPPLHNAAMPLAHPFTGRIYSWARSSFTLQPPSDLTPAACGTVLPIRPRPPLRLHPHASLGSSYSLLRPPSSLAGQGASSSVMKCLCKKLVLKSGKELQKVTVAVKQIQLDSVATTLSEIQREIRTNSSLRHPNVVSYYTSFIVSDVTDGSDTLWIVMEYMDCGELPSLPGHLERGVAPKEGLLPFSSSSLCPRLTASHPPPPPPPSPPQARYWISFGFGGRAPRAARRRWRTRSSPRSSRGCCRGWTTCTSKG